MDYLSGLNSVEYYSKSCIKGNEPTFDGIFDQLDTTMQAQFWHNIRPVCLHCSRAEDQTFRNILITEPLGYKLQDFPFPGGQSIIASSILTGARPL